MENTPTPWTLGKHGGINAKLPSGQTVQITCMAPTRFTGKDETEEAVAFMNQTEANARFIVTACNSHYELLAACELVFDGLLSNPPDLDTAELGARRILGEAIAKAKGG